MNDLWGWAIYAWIGLPTVMYGGYALLGLVAKKDAPSPFQRTWFRAGHAHAGVFLVMFLVFLDFIARTGLSNATMHIACGIFVLGILAQSGGFFVHMSRGQPETPSIGTRLTSGGAVLLAVAICILVYGIATTGLSGA